MADYIWTQTAASITASANLFGAPISATVPGTNNTVSGSPLDWNASTNTGNTSYWFDAENFASKLPNGPFIGGTPGTSDNVYLGILPSATITGTVTYSGFTIPVTVKTFSNQTSTNDGAYTVTAGPSDTISIANLYMGGDTYAGAGGTETISPTLLIDSGHVSISGALNGVTDIPLGIVTVGESYGIRPAGTVALENAGTLTVAGSADPLTVEFLDGSANDVTLGTLGEATSSFTLDFSNFQSGNEVILSGGVGALDLSASGGGATVTGSLGNVTFDLIFTAPAGQQYVTGPSGNIFINNDIVTTSVACFTAGTRIAAALGEQNVETLRAGDLVMTLTGLQPIRWIGHRDLDLTRHPHPERAQPVRILRDAFAPGMPARDLRLSPDHAIFWNGVLTHAKLLINGTTLVQETVDRVSYFHIELDEHTILFAEKLRTESYLDTGNRGMFENAEDAFILHPDFSIHALDDACAPVVLHGAALAAIRRHLLDRAAALGFSTTLDPGLYLMAGDRRIDPVILEDGRRRFNIPKDAYRIRLRSRSAMPCRLLGDSTDTRVLGAFIRQIRLSEPTGPRDLALDSAALGEGWYPPEPEGRWTNGDALLELTGPCILEITLAGSLPYPNLRPARIHQAA